MPRSLAPSTTGCSIVIFGEVITCSAALARDVRSKHNLLPRLWLSVRSQSGQQTWLHVMADLGHSANGACKCSHTLKSTLNGGFNIRVTCAVSHTIRWISESLTANLHPAPDLSHLDTRASQWGVFVLSRHGTMGQPEPGV
ncbi:hypothetical protein NQZ68_021643 [Dissostichus eleginoides]|nr:hypothetical protein NQZ68_021643 [Dissostichus eleginoides]